MKPEDQLLNPLEELEQAKRQAEKAIRAKNEFMSRVSHEIRTPLSAIIGMTHIALGAKTLEKAKECLEKIDDSSRHLLRLINDILDMSKLEAQKLTIVNEKFDFEAMLRDVVSITSVKSDEKQQSFHIRMDSDVSRFYLGDSLRISQILLNLLYNAIKFTPKYGKIHVNVERTAQEDGYSRFRISVSDTGVGIPAENLPALFDSFEQAEGGMNRRFDGIGLGLAICKSLVDTMGGTISVESEENKGSTFTVELRLKDAGSSDLASAVSEEIDLRKLKAYDDKTAEELKMENKLPEISDMEIKAYVNSEEALARVRGNAKIYKTLLNSFLNSTQFQQLKTEIAEGDFDAAAKSAHALKGVSANLSLPAVYELAVLIESQLKSGLAVDNTLAKFEDVMSKTVDCIQAVIGRV